MKSVPSLHLDKLKLNLEVEKLLRQEIAYQCHALPVSFDGNKVTVALSSPEDAIASTKVSSTIEWPVSFVKDDQYAIDRRLAEIWQESNVTNGQLIFDNLFESAYLRVPLD